MTNERNCILRIPCDNAGKEGVCTPLCPHYITLHGASGKGGCVSRSNIPRDYAKVTIANSPVREAQPEIYKLLDEYVKTFKRQFEEGRIKSLYLFSEETGTGKTTTAAALANEFIVRHYVGSKLRGLQPLKRPAYFLDVNEWQRLYNQFNRDGVPTHIKEPASERYYEELEIAHDVPFLVMDDIGIRGATEGFKGDLHSIINYRSVKRLPTIYTSNLPIDDIATLVSKQVWDRVRDMCKVIYFEGESKRGFRRKDHD